MVGIDIEWEDRDVTIYVGGREVSYATHDLHGSAGVEAVVDTARNIARAMNLPVYEREL